MNTKFALSAIALAIPFIASANLVVNGDFELGNTGFTSSHNLVIGTGTALFPAPPVAPANAVSGPGPADDNMYDEGTYTVTNAQPGAWHALWRNDLDLIGHNRYMLINGDTAAGTTVWSQAIVPPLVDGQLYRLSFDVANVLSSGTAAAQLSLSLGNSIVLNVNAPAGNAQWQNVFGDFIFESSGGSNANILNAIVAFEGNDFAIDNIILEAVPEPFTMALGAAGIGIFLRRRMKTKKS